MMNDIKPLNCCCCCCNDLSLIFWNINITHCYASRRIGHTGYNWFQVMKSKNSRVYHWWLLYTDWMDWLHIACPSDSGHFRRVESTSKHFSTLFRLTTDRLTEWLTDWATDSSSPNYLFRRKPFIPTLKLAKYHMPFTLCMFL